MYNEEIEKLIEMALLDGSLSERERQILLSKAESMGINLAEFEMVLEAKLFEKNKRDNSTVVNSDKMGSLVKCPACGAIAETFSTKCNDCGTEFRNISASKNIIHFSEKLDEIESTRTETAASSDKNTGCFELLKWIMFWYILLPIKIIQFFINRSKPPKWSITDTRKEELILNFPVPMSREEIIEFLTLAVSKINSNTYWNAFSDDMKNKGAWNAVWFKKIQQIQSKASIAMINDKASLEIVNKIVLSVTQSINENNKKILHISIAFAAVVILLIIMMSI
jgi:hypothetical protein